MNNTLKNIFRLYLNNKIFLIVWIVWLLSMTATRFVDNLSFLISGEELEMIIFVEMMWLSFHFGVLIKRQLANHRALLLPRYRSLHTNLFSLLYAIFIFVALFWHSHYGSVLNVSYQTDVSLYLMWILFGLIFVYLGFLSIGRVILYAYVIILLFTYSSSNIILWLEQWPFLSYVLMAAIALFILFFRRRLMNLNEECFEYNSLLTWPARKNVFIQEQSQSAVSLLKIVKNIFKIKNSVEMTAYPRESNVFIRAFHWNYPEQRKFAEIWLLFILVTPIYVWFLSNQPIYEGFFQKVDTNFLLLAITPVVITLGMNYKNISYLRFDVIKPVRREVLIKEKGIVLFAQLFLNWLLFSLCYAIVPTIYLQSKLLVIFKYWEYLALTGIFAFVVFSWVAVLAALNQSSKVIIQGFFLSNLILFQFYCAPYFSKNFIMVNNVVCLILTVFLISRAYKMWCQKEFV